jgi:hypothetical protein
MALANVGISVVAIGKPDTITLAFLLAESFLPVSRLNLVLI